MSRDTYNTHELIHDIYDQHKDSIPSYVDELDELELFDLPIDDGE